MQLSMGEISRRFHIDQNEPPAPKTGPIDALAQNFKAEHDITDRSVWIVTET